VRSDRCSETCVATEVLLLQRRARIGGARLAHTARSGQDGPSRPEKRRWKKRRRALENEPESPHTPVPTLEQPDSYLRILPGLWIMDKAVSASTMKRRNNGKRGGQGAIYFMTVDREHQVVVAKQGGHPQFYAHEFATMKLLNAPERSATRRLLNGSSDSVFAANPAALAGSLCSMSEEKTFEMVKKGERRPRERAH